LIGQRLIFGFDSVHTIKNKNGVEIDDIDDEEENEWFLKKCLELTFQFTNNSETAVYFSIAGGRKTMSSCLMVAAQFYGRPQDRVYHVLVSPEFESNKDFFYPPRKSQAIELKDENGQPYKKETRYAKITLVPIPFVSVRQQISDDLLKEPKDPATLLLSLVREGYCSLTVDLPGGKIMYKNKELDLHPAKLALYTFFVLQKKNCRRETASCEDCTACYCSVEDIITRSGEITELYRKLAKKRPVEEMSDTGITSLSKANFQSFKSKIRKDIEGGFGLYALPELAIESFGKKPDTRFGIKFDKERIRVVL
jgi:CRISPR-associated protein Csx14